MNTCHARLPRDACPKGVFLTLIGMRSLVGLDAVRTLLVKGLVSFTRRASRPLGAETDEIPWTPYVQQTLREPSRLREIPFPIFTTPLGTLLP